MTNIPRCEHPRPDLMRESWVCLNGEWEFEIDNAVVGEYKEFYKRNSLDGKITVPFCPESKLSGVENTDFMNCVWYRRDLDIPAEWSGKRIIFHIGACDYKTTVYINGKRVGEHSGGYTPMKFDITDYLNESGNYVTVSAFDDIRSENQVAGKQCAKLNSYGCYYTRTTGIWQTVWMEAVEEAYIISYKADANISAPSVNLEVFTSAASLGAELNVTAYYEGKEMGKTRTKVSSASTSISVKLSEAHLWECGNGRLYDLKFELTKDGRTDLLNGYFGLREVLLTKEKGLQINGKTVFGRFVLDQGFYPAGIYTAPTDDALIFDIQASLDCGFNGARLHQKVFEPRFLYHADRMGYMVWDETGNWGLDHTLAINIYNFLPEWLEELERDYSHPSLIGWCPFNETWTRHDREQSMEFLDTVYDITKAFDKSRPIITSSGSFPTRRTDVHDVHDYEQDPVKFKANYSEMDKGIMKDQLYRMNSKRQVYKTELPVFISEYGGIGWSFKNGWGYGQSVKDEAEFFSRLEGLTDSILENEHIFGFCYTQLTDVEQEQNGLLYYDRTFKFDPKRYHRIISKKARIEE